MRSCNRQCKFGFGADLPPIKGRALALTSHALADKVGQKILDEGGNAIDAAVAIGYALAVVHPSSGNLGGACRGAFSQWGKHHPRL